MKRALLLSLWITSIQCIAQTHFSYPRGVLTGYDSLYNMLPQKAPLIRNYFVGMPDHTSLKKFAPAAGNQDSFGTCTGWAIAYAARTILEAQKNKWTNTDSITFNAFSGPFQYRLAAPKKLNCDGAYTSDCIKTLSTYGSIPIKNFNSDPCLSDPLRTTDLETATNYKIEEFNTLWDSNYRDKLGKLNRVKKSLLEGNPIVISMICPPSFNKIGKNGLWLPTESPNPSYGGHALCVVGYNNRLFGGAFELLNSWGESRGAKGYVWIKYKDFSRFVYQAYELIQLPTSALGEPYLKGSLRIFDIDKQENMPVLLADRVRNWNVARGSGSYTYKVVSNLVSGSKMRMYLKSEEPAFVYMLGTGSIDKSVNVLFPLKGFSAAMNYKNYEIAIPSEEFYFQMDETEGKDYIIIIYSKEKLDIEYIKNRFINSVGTIPEKLSQSINSDLLIGYDKITFEQNEIKFLARNNNSKQKAIAIIIEFNHGAE